MVHVLERTDAVLLREMIFLVMKTNTTRITIIFSVGKYIVSSGSIRF